MQLKLFVFTLLYAKSSPELVDAIDTFTASRNGIAWIVSAFININFAQCSIISGFTVADKLANSIDAHAWQAYPIANVRGTVVDVCLADCARETEQTNTLEIIDQVNTLDSILTW